MNDESWHIFSGGDIWLVCMYTTGFFYIFYLPIEKGNLLKYIPSLCLSTDWLVLRMPKAKMYSSQASYFSMVLIQSQRTQLYYSYLCFQNSNTCTDPFNHYIAFVSIYGALDPKNSTGRHGISLNRQATLSYLKIDKKHLKNNDRGHCHFLKSTSDIGLF